MSLPGNMGCQEFVELVTEYFDGVLPDADRTRFDEHLRGCPPCVVYLGQMRMTMAAVGATREDVERSPATAALLAAFRDFMRDPGARNATAAAAE
jgi:anti-sigma factor RsiW